MPRTSALVLLLALLIYAGLRWAVLAWSFDGVAIPNYELFMGNIGIVAGDGWFGPPLHRYYDNCGGHLATGLFALPLFELFGETYLALKLVPLILGAITLLLIHAVLRRHAGPVAAMVGVLAFAIGPPTLAKYSMLAKGNHFENLAFQLLMVWTFYRMHSAESEGRRKAWLLAFAASAGFAVFFYFGSLAMLALLALTHLAVRGFVPTLKDILPAVPAFLVGLSPLIWVFIGADARPGSFLDSKLGEGSGRNLQDALARMESLWTELLPKAGCFEDLGPVSGQVAEWAFLGVFALAWLSLLPATLAGLWSCLRNREAGREAESTRFRGLAQAPFVFYLPFFSLLFSVSSFDFDAYAPPVEIGQYRYLVPHFTFATLVFGWALAGHLGSDAAWRRGLGLLLAVVLGATQLFTLPIAKEELAVPGVASRYAGYDFVYENNVLMRDSVPDPVTGAPTWDMPAMRAELEEFPVHRRSRALLGIGFYLAWAQTLPGSKKAAQPREAGIDLAELLEPFPPEFHPDLGRGVGAFLRTPIGPRPPVQKKLERFLAPLVATDSPALAWVMEGLNSHSEFPLARRTKDLLNQSLWLGSLVPAAQRPSWQRGLGRALGEWVARGVPSDREQSNEVLDRFAASEDLWFGFGFAFAHKADAERGDALTADLAERAPGAALEARAWQGLGAGMRHELGLERAGEIFEGLREELAPEKRDNLELGLRWPGYPAPFELPR